MAGEGLLAARFHMQFMRNYVNCSALKRRSLIPVSANRLIFEMQMSPFILAASIWRVTATGYSLDYILA
ncbi:hypothetical protein SCLCIDRAFT_1214700 [Scleroderma citrinum Foug A]|uniref:Uncharacterized protein n=1 Tax=Scleroderma citrinum Foug A TaxID=1036808 RepID=A0A0C3AD89_9AGAM|nr:hypothetical protein SCLCIDRAFT_1214700 [Scleroderma citrinum Foug A]